MAGPATLLYRCDAGYTVGFGHLTRGLAIARAALERHGVRTIFAGTFEDAAATRILDAGFRMIAWPGQSEADWLRSVLSGLDRPVIICDVRTHLTMAELLVIRRLVRGLIVLDDASERRLVADLAILPPTPLAHALDWSGFRGRVEIGWQWTILGRPPLPDLFAVRPTPPWRLLVTMGGSDPQGLTMRAAKALAPFAGDLVPIVVLGPGFRDPASQAAQIRSLLPVAEIVEPVEDLRPLMARCDAALTSYGVTALELAAAGVPSLYLCLTDDHAQSAAALAQTGACLSLGRFDLVSDRTLAETVMNVLRAPQRRAAMSRIGPSVIDGRGAERIADEIGRFFAVQATGGG